jgi:hypothetical protein
MFTTVASSMARPDPAIVGSAHRPAGVPILTRAEGGFVTSALILAQPRRLR